MANASLSWKGFNNMFLTLLNGHYDIDPNGKINEVKHKQKCGHPRSINGQGGAPPLRSARSWDGESLGAR